MTTREILCTCGTSRARHVDVGAGRFGIYGPCTETGCAGFTAACAECERPARAGDAYCSDDCAETAWKAALPVNRIEVPC